MKERIPLERVEGIEPSPPAWKAGALPLSYTRLVKLPIAEIQMTKHEYQSSHSSFGFRQSSFLTVGEAGFEPAKAEPPDLQSGPFGRSGIPPFGQQQLLTASAVIFEVDPATRPSTANRNVIW